VRIGGPPAIVNLYFTGPDGQITPLTRTVVETPNPRDVTFELENEILTSSLRVEVNSVRDREPTHVHLWEISLQ
jgi:hypothetical protein